MDTASVRTLYEDSSGNVWIGTYGRGWYRYRNASGLLRMPEDRNHNLSNVHAFVADAKGYLWLSTNNGLFRFLLSDLDGLQRSDQPIFYNYFTREYGFLTNEFNGGADPSVITMPDGRIVFPGMNGLVIFDPAKVPAEGPGSVLLIEEVSLDNKAIELPEGASLPPDFNTLSLSVAIPYFGQHNNLQVEYQLSGGSAVWTQLPDDGVININRLTYGDYVLTIRMLKGYGSRDYIYKIISFSVDPHWYQTNWFRVAALLLFVAIVFLLSRIRIRNIQRQKEHLEEVVASRTRELEIRTRELEASEEKIKQNTQFKSQVTSLVLHDVRSPLYYLNKITGNIYKSTEGKVPDTIRDELKDLHLSVKDIAAYAQTLFAWISAQQDDFILKAVKIKLADLLEEICGNYQLLAIQNNNTLSYKAAPELSVITQADLLQIVIRNLVDNAIKFTANGSIILTAELIGTEVYITVKDTGKGMVADRVERILGKDADDVADTRSGMGYRLIRDLLKKMGGRLAVISEQGKGSAVTIILPAPAV
jgi:signal transduction histidine kinase